MSIYRGRNRRDFSLASALYDSIVDNDFRGVSMLIEKGADANIVLQKTGISPFHLVIGNDCEDFAIKTTKLILRSGADPNIQSDDGLTPLHIAAAWGRTEIVELLLSCGGDPEKRDINHTLPISYAIEYKHQECINILLKFMNTDVTIQTSQEKEDYQLTLEKVILNNGIAEAEYEVDSGKENTLDLDNSENNLQLLPRTTPIEYVRNWCSKNAREKCLSNTKSTNLEENNLYEEKYETETKSCDIINLSSETSIFSPEKFPFINCKPRNLKKNVTENFTLPYESSIKYTLRRNKSLNKKGINIPAVSSSFCKHIEASRESGITTLPDTSLDISSTTDLNVRSFYDELNKSIEDTNVKIRLDKNLIDASSDYFTSNEISGSTNILEQNIYDLSPVSSEGKNLYVTKCSSHGLNFSNEITNINGVTNVPCNITEDLDGGSIKDANRLSIMEVYKYTDNQEGVVFYEKRFLKNPKSDGIESNTSAIQSVQSSKLSSLPASFDYDTDSLRKELTQCGYNPGPITQTTKRIYLRKLHHLKRRPSIPLDVSKTAQNVKVYSVELEKALKNPNWIDNIVEYKKFDDIVCKEFNKPDPSRKWREGLTKSSFTYLLLDPRITNNLPARAELMSAAEVWQTFVSSIFYVGKGKRSRPYSHLYEAAAFWKEKNNTTTNKKLQHILNIWNDNFGVVCLHVFQNVIPVEAYTREASMINALKINNIKNIKSGDFYGIAATWSPHQQKMLGVLLLYRAMMIFLNEGERQLRPADIN